jgi:hypothetical protein
VQHRVAGPRRVGEALVALARLDVERPDDDLAELDRRPDVVLGRVDRPVARR